MFRFLCALVALLAVAVTAEARGRRVAVAKVAVAVKVVQPVVAVKVVAVRPAFVPTYSRSVFVQSSFAAPCYSPGVAAFSFYR